MEVAPLFRILPKVYLLRMFENEHQDNLPNRKLVPIVVQRGILQRMSAVQRTVFLIKLRRLRRMDSLPREVELMDPCPPLLYHIL